jgi:hypothetical protein
MNWINIKHSLPGIDEVVLFYEQSGKIFQGSIGKEDMEDNLFLINYLDGITHWCKIIPPSFKCKCGLQPLFCMCY